MAIASMGTTVLDCPDPRTLAAFYAAVLGWETAQDSDDDWVELEGPGGYNLAFQRSEGHRPPQWPGTEHGQQAHLDLDVPGDAREEAERQVLELGATLLQGDDGGRRSFRVYADPAGHPFCLCYPRPQDT
ncbi:VOC family protein [Streptomyces sp. TRM 70351]|uniref:VOC family protein n=1 Tax=Streptomyces sp. TRM 70351 TaxID=3116552 RepID=UPI002E7C25A6|nr:VOC family protein [Streptomyces sp. TRM 70351]MEE1929338.1 VOC family protein [Streptomyces sp. TRM 70351]